MVEPRRLFASALPERGGEVVLDQEAGHHAHVLRLAAGDPVVLFDGRGHEASGRVRAVSDRVVCEVGPPREGAAPPSEVVLVLGLPKAGKLDGIVRMVTEAGATAVHLALTDRAVARTVDAKRTEARMARLRRVAREAARQAGRADVPRLEPPAPLSEVLAQRPPEATLLVADPRASQPLAEAAAPVSPARSGATWVVVGPEGGLSPDEHAALEAAGGLPVRLGPHVLRVETAAPVAVALVVGRGAPDSR